MDRITRTTRLLIVIAIVIILLTLFMFLWKVPIFHFRNEIDATKFEEFGDYLGGIFGAISFILLIYTYNLQHEETHINRQTQDIEYINILYNNIVDDISNAVYGKYKGLEAIYNFKWNSEIKNSIMDTLNSILLSFENLIEIAKNDTNYKNDKIKDITLTRIYFLFYSKVLWSVDTGIWEQREILLSDHDDSKFIIPRFAKITQETVKYLTDRGLIAPNKDHIKSILEYTTKGV